MKNTTKQNRKELIKDILQKEFDYSFLENLSRYDPERMSGDTHLDFIQFHDSVLDYFKSDECAKSYDFFCKDSDLISKVVNEEIYRLNRQLLPKQFEIVKELMNECDEKTKQNAMSSFIDKDSVEERQDKLITFFRRLDFFNELRIFYPEKDFHLVRDD